MTKSPLMKIIEDAAARFNSRPRYRASIEARAELNAVDGKLQNLSQSNQSTAPNSND